MDLIGMAYDRYADGKRNPSPWLVPIEGGPTWIDSDRYTIEAKAEASTSREMMSGPMMQALLEGRLLLRTHRATREVPVYELTVAKGGPKLQVAQEGKCTIFDPSHPPPRPTPGTRPS